MSVSSFWPDWPGPEGDDNIEYSDPREEYAAVDVRLLFIPYSKVAIRKCDDCGESYVNKAFLHEHIRKAHPAPSRPERPSRPESIPSPVAPGRVRPEADPRYVRSEAAPAAPVPAATPVPVPRDPRRGAPRSVPSTRGRNRNTTRGK
jgi:hypothetical protein